MFTLKFKVATLVLALLIIFTGLAIAENDKALRLFSNETLWANMIKQIDIPFTAENIILEYDIKTELATGHNWGGAVHLYWDDIEYYVAIKRNRSMPLVRPYQDDDEGGLAVHPGRIRISHEIFAVSQGVWHGNRIELTPSDMIFSARNLGDDWIEVERLNRPITAIISQPSSLILGVGSELHGEPLLRNSDRPRNVGAYYFDNIVLTVDGEVIYEESFDNTTIDELGKEWDIAADPENTEAKFEIVPADASIL